MAGFIRRFVVGDNDRHIPVFDRILESEEVTEHEGQVKVLLESKATGGNAL